MWSQQMLLVQSPWLWTLLYVLPAFCMMRYECNKALKSPRNFHINCKPEASVL